MRTTLENYWAFLEKEGTGFRDLLKCTGGTNRGVYLQRCAAGTDPVILDLRSMGKGQVWANGHKKYADIAFLLLQEMVSEEPVSCVGNLFKACVFCSFSSTNFVQS